MVLIVDLTSAKLFVLRLVFYYLDNMGLTAPDKNGTEHCQLCEIGSGIINTLSAMWDWPGRVFGSAKCLSQLL